MPLHSLDLVDPSAKEEGRESDLACHCLTTKANITACALTTANYQPRFAKKQLNLLILDFRQFYEFNPAMYRAVSETTPGWGASLAFPAMTQMFEPWPYPEDGGARSGEPAGAGTAVLPLYVGVNFRSICKYCYSWIGDLVVSRPVWHWIDIVGRHMSRR